jgi:hypothetical protein
MARRRRGFGEAPLKIGGYVKDGGRRLTDGHGNTIGTGRKTNCTRIRPGAPGSWISSERCSYQFKVGDAAYSCRGYGDEMSASCRRMKKFPRGLAGARARRRR